MEKITHKQVRIGNLNLHIAEAGSGPAVLLLHGFPEIWYSWRYQIIALADAGFHAIAPDFRGYGLSDQPQDPENATFADLVDDMASLLAALSIDQVCVIGKDFGAIIAYSLALLHPNKVKCIVTMGIPYIRPGIKSISMITEFTPPGFYIKHWQEPGRGLADFNRFDVRSVVQNIYTLFSGSELPVAEEGREIMDLFDPTNPLPTWFTEEDLQVYSSLYEKSGFVYPLQVPYLCMKRDWGKLEQITETTIKSPFLLIMGDKDYFLKMPGMTEYVNSDMLKSDVPNLEIKFVKDGSHFVQEQFPEEVNKLLLPFLNRQK